jgi:hypothetical protein
MGKVTEQTGYENCFVEGTAIELRRKQICSFQVLTIRVSLHS